MDLHDQNLSDESDINDINLVNVCFNPTAMLDTLQMVEETEEDVAESSVVRAARRYSPRDRVAAGERL